MSSNAHQSSSLSTRTICKTVLHHLPDIDALYLFGSHAQGRERRDSDIDLAIMTSAPMPTLARVQTQMTLGADLGKDVDLVDLREANTVLRLEVIQHGQLLYRRDADQVLAFEARVLGEYAEWMDATRPLRETIYARGSIR